MSGPFIFIATNRLRAGALAAERARVPGLVAFVREHEPRLLAFNEYVDEDPIRRKCVGEGNNADSNLPAEQVCSADGSLGVVLPILVPAELTTTQRYPSLPCDPSLPFAFGPAPLRPNGDPVRCPNGDVARAVLDMWAWAKFYPAFSDFLIKY